MPSVENTRLLALLADEQPDLRQETKFPQPLTPTLDEMTVAADRHRIDDHIKNEGITGRSPSPG